MPRKLPTLRSAMITTTATLITGSTVDAIATYLSSHQLGIGAFIIAMTASWVLDRLNSIINSTNELTTIWIRPLNAIQAQRATVRQREYRRGWQITSDGRR